MADRSDRRHADHFHMEAGRAKPIRVLSRRSGVVADRRCTRRASANRRSHRRRRSIDPDRCGRHRADVTLSRRRLARDVRLLGPCEPHRRHHRVYIECRTCAAICADRTRRFPARRDAVPEHAALDRRPGPRTDAAGPSDRAASAFPHLWVVLSHRDPTWEPVVLKPLRRYYKDVPARENFGGVEVRELRLRDVIPLRSVPWRRRRRRERRRPAPRHNVRVRLPKQVPNSRNRADWPQAPLRGSLPLLYRRTTGVAPSRMSAAVIPSFIDDFRNSGDHHGWARQLNRMRRARDDEVRAYSGQSCNLFFRVILGGPHRTLRRRGHRTIAINIAFF